MPKDVIGFIGDHFSIPPKGDFASHACEVLPIRDMAMLQLELVDLQTSDVVKSEFKNTEIHTLSGYRKVSKHQTLLPGAPNVQINVFMCDN